MTNVFSPCPDRWNLESPNDGASCIGTVPYDCLGEALCVTMNKHHKYCDLAVNASPLPRSAQNMVSNTDSAGHCYADSAGLGCKVFVHGTQADGSNCAYDGQTVWNIYQNIYNASIGGCATCGSYHFGNGCMVSSDYDFGCKQRSDVDDF
jgi:Meiotically up-regulated gene family